MSDLYVSVEEVDDHFEYDVEFGSTWSDLTTKDKEKYIYSAMRTLDKMSEWGGVKTNNQQKYEFPRDWVYKRNAILSRYGYYSVEESVDNNYFMYNNKIPDKIKRAIYIIIQKLYKDVNKYNSFKELGDRNVTSFSDANVSISLGDKVSINNEYSRELFQLIYPYTLTGWSKLV
jgi:hypothetical protein